MRCLTPPHASGVVGLRITRLPSNSATVGGASPASRVPCSAAVPFAFVADKTPSFSRSASKREPSGLSLSPLTASDHCLLLRLLQLIAKVSGHSPSPIGSPVPAGGSEDLCWAAAVATLARSGGGSRQLREVADVSPERVERVLAQALMRRQLAPWLASNAAQVRGVSAEEGLRAVAVRSISSTGESDAAGGSGAMVSNGAPGLLHLVAGMGWAWAVPQLMSAGFDLNSRDGRGLTALHWAAGRGR